MPPTWTSTSAHYVTPRTGQRDAWTEDTAQRGHAGTNRLLEVAETTPPTGVADALQVPAGEPVVVRRRLVELDGRPIELADSYYPVSIARGTGLAEHRKIRGGAPTLLAELGHAPHQVEEEVTARPSTGQERELLDLEDGEPVLVLERLVRDADGQPVEVSVMTMAAEGRRLRYELSA
ncbi:hypothetical protein GCM10012275_53270 [Longimycelium tulufanense]|uniref:UbiC transcription regulator-associated domain-containing protein n=1 Tax=Longimycelium tulufanense TaxID=907463 RepID=A0A8J3CD40_9PSEU|nr:UTRA domain-containing protein [Longimycelium tulufanense]GGM75863.1 hypothetical protein GCM10012275_53270 [Longimycelium tulufanense]